MRRELEALKERLRGQQKDRQRDHDAAQAAKDAIIDQLRRELHDTQARLNDAENKLVELTTSRAAEIVSQIYLRPSLIHSYTHTLYTVHTEAARCDYCYIMEGQAYSVYVCLADVKH